jgi:hypothetical protein
LRALVASSLQFKYRHTKPRQHRKLFVSIDGSLRPQPPPAAVPNMAQPSPDISDPSPPSRPVHRAPRVPKQAWEKHRSAIIKLYQQNELETVRSRMKEEANFDAK